MYPKVIRVSLLVGMAASAHAATILSDDFSNGGPTGSIAGWTEIGSNLFGGIGAETSANHPGGTGSGFWAYFQTNETSTAGMFRSTGVNGALGDTITLTFDLGGNSTGSGNNYTGTFTASLWDGSPTAGGVQLATITPANPGSQLTSPITLQYTLAAATTNNIFVRFNAGVTAPGSGFDQAVIDNVNLDLAAVPEPSVALLGGMGLLGLLRRRR